jgi:hypothetical protein
MLREFESAAELIEFYRDLRARTNAWHLPPPPTPAPPIPTPAAAAAQWLPIRMTPLARILRAVAQEFATPTSVIRSDSRLQSAVVPRQVVALLARELTNTSTSKIGLLLGHRDHSTIIHSIRAMAARIAADPKLAARVQRLRDTLLEEEDRDHEIWQHQCHLAANDNDRV